VAKVVKTFLKQLAQAESQPSPQWKDWNFDANPDLVSVLLHFRDIGFNLVLYM